MEIEARLERRRQELLGRIDELRDDGLGQSFKESTQELSSYDNHSSDNASELYEREKDFGLLDGLRSQVRQVEEAQRRLRAGSYGRCLRCGGRIEPERLTALPWAATCARCATEEVARRRGGPPAPHALPREREMFSHSFRDGKDEVGFDGEDTWQALARYGNANSPQDTPPARRIAEAYIDAGELHDAVEPVELLVDSEGESLEVRSREVDPDS
jgi:YteA family regulatory protein